MNTFTKNLFLWITIILVVLLLFNLFQNGNSGRVSTELAYSDFVESVKAASDVYSPLSGEIIAVNDSLEASPEIINDSPYDDGWFFKIKPDNLDELADLLDAESYADTCED